MAARPKITVTPEELAGYRRVPGYGKMRLPDLPGGMYSIATKGKTSRRYYNPFFPVGDPRREIGDSTYYRLRRQADQDTRDFIKQRDEGRKRRAEINRETERLVAQEQGLDFSRVREVRENIAVLNYASGNVWSREDRLPGGYLATLLEELGWRPPNAPWMVGQSGSERATPNGTVPSVAMAVWRSQSAIRGRVA